MRVFLWSGWSRPFFSHNLHRNYVKTASFWQCYWFLFFAHVPSMQKSVSVLLWWQACSFSRCNATNNGQFHRCLSIFLGVTLREFRNGKCLLRACTDPCNNTHYVPYDCVFQQSVKYLHFSVLTTLDPSTDLIICSLKNKNTMPR